MMDLDLGKYFDLLKASAAQMLCLALACALLLYLDEKGLLPVALEGWKPVVMIAGFLFGALGVASVCNAMSKALAFLGRKLRLRWKLWAHAREFEDYIPHMTDQERAIYGQLLHENRKSFDADDDGGYAAPLLGRKFVIISAQPGQMLDLTRVPFRVPDHIWNVLVKHRDKFSYTPDPRRGDAWRIHWMVR